MTSQGEAYASTGPGDEGARNDLAPDAYDISSTKSRSRFRFKSKESRREGAMKEKDKHRSKRRRTDGQDANPENDHRHRERRSRHHHHRTSRHKEENDEPPRVAAHGLNSETAFRESLFDAMADDEGASFWEGVYGQPIHTYPNTKPADPDDPASEVQQMSDEEYVAYVRQQMWEKTHQHVIEERKRRAEAAQRRRQEAKRTGATESEKDAFNRKIEESLRRGEQRKKERAWRDAWAVYTRKWEALLARGKAEAKSPGNSLEDENIATLIPWPNRSSKQADISREEVAAFLEQAASREDLKEQGLRGLLKAERVRWHPDKMQQRFGQLKLDTDTMKAVVAVFQIVDDMWAQASAEHK